MKRWLLTAVAVALLAVSTSARAQQKYTFALVPKAMNSPFSKIARDGCMKAQSELTSLKCVYIGPAENIESEQVDIVKDLISKHIDGIAVAASNAADMADALKAAKAAGIPVVTWDSDLLPQDKKYRSAYIGTHNYDIGVNLANIVQKMKPNGGKICLQTGGASAANHNERLQGIRDTLGGRSGTVPPGDPLKGEKGWTEVAGSPLITDDDTATAVQQLQDILSQYPDLDVYITTAGFTQRPDDAFRQVMKPYKDKLKNGQFVFVAGDAIALQMQQMKDGLSLGQVGQRPFEMGWLAMYRLLDLKNGKTLTDPEYTGLDVCMKDNAHSCLGKNPSRF